MNKKKKVIYALILHTIIAILSFFILSYFRYEFFFLKGVFFQLIIFGIYLIFLFFLLVSMVYIFYRYGLIFSSPWKNAMWGGDYSWWIEEELNSEVFWRSVLTQLVISICFLIVGMALIIIALYLG